MLPPRPGSNDAEGDDAEELKAVMKRLQDAKPPPDVLKVSICHPPRQMHLYSKSYVYSALYGTQSVHYCGRALDSYTTMTPA